MGSAALGGGGVDLKGRAGNAPGQHHHAWGRPFRGRLQAGFNVVLIAAQNRVALTRQFRGKTQAHQLGIRGLEGAIHRGDRGNGRVALQDPQGILAVRGFISAAHLAVQRRAKPFMGLGQKQGLGHLASGFKNSALQRGLATGHIAAKNHQKTPWIDVAGKNQLHRRLFDQGIERDKAGWYRDQFNRGQSVVRGSEGQRVPPSGSWGPWGF